MKRKVCLLSCWNHFHAQSFVRELADLPDVEIVAVWDEEAHRGRKYAEEFGLPFEPDLDVLLARPDLDGVVIDTAPEQAASLIIKAAQAGKHVMADQVLAMSRKEALIAKEAIEKAGIIFALDMSLKRWPIHLAAKQVLESGRIGSVTSLRVRNAHSGALGGLGQQWPPQFRQSTYGVFADLGAHCLYLMLWLLGMPLAVTAIGTRRTETIGEDNAASIFEFENGTIAICDTSHVANNSPFSMEMYGTMGSFRANGMNGVHHKLLKQEDVTVHLFTQDQQTHPNPMSLLPPMPGEPSIHRWIKAMDGEVEPALNGTQEGISLAIILEGLYLSARTGTKVTFDEI
ncbi:Gfo/Idh/MocA family protein [Paenibacillus sp. P36]|uniref:Gfo/Idh/MocA family protein n=1 Tax=Paenibacillus sp. P36 TaxID=3342538 RepID=UPI0038B25198